MKARPVPEARAHRVPVLDLARFLAAVAVVAYHYGFQGGVAGEFMDTYVPGLGAVTQYGYLGVDVFFVISGFVIAWSAEGQRAGRFAWSRWLRVYPTFVFCVLLTSAVVTLAGDARLAVTGRQVLVNLLIDARHLGQPFVDGVYWTIVYEVQFYAMVAIGLAVPWLRRHATACLTLWLLLSVLNAFVLHKSALAHLLISNFSGLFIAGMMLYRLHRGRFSAANIALFVAALGFALAMELQMADVRFVPLHTAWSPWIVGVLFLVPVALLSLALRRRFAPATERALQRIGALTYPLYLLHATIGYVLIDRLAPRLGAVAAIALTVLAMLALAAWVAASVEPRLKAFFVARVKPATPAPTATAAR